MTTLSELQRQAREAENLKAVYAILRSPAPPSAARPPARRRRGALLLGAGAVVALALLAGTLKLFSLLGAH